MQSYVILSSWTQKGIENLKDSPARLDRIKEVFQAAGVTLKDFYLTMGRHDHVVIVEAPDDRTLASAILKIAQGGAIRTETLRSFTEDEYRKLLEGA